MRIEYSNIVLRKLEILKNKLEDEFGEEVCRKKIIHILNTLDNLVFSSMPGESVQERFGIKTDYRFLILPPNIFILRVKEERIIILQMFNEKEDFIYKLFKIRMRNKESLKYWGE